MSEFPIPDLLFYFRLGRKHPLCNVSKEQPLCKKTRFAYWSDRTVQHDGLT